MNAKILLRVDMEMSQVIFSKKQLAELEFLR